MTLNNLKDLYFRYSPSPSETLLQKGKIVDKSYFSAKGQLQLSKLEKVPCEFEIAHMEDGLSWAVLYVDFSQIENPIEYGTYRRDFSQKQRTFRRFKNKEKVVGILKNFRPQPVESQGPKRAIKPTIQNSEYNISLYIKRRSLVKSILRSRYIKLAGVDTLRAELIQATLIKWVNMKGDENSLGLRIVFLVDEYSAVNNVQQVASISYHFDLVNLPIDSQYSLEHSSEHSEIIAEEELRDKSLRAAIETTLRRNSTDTEAEVIEKALAAAAQIEEELFANPPHFSREYIPIKIGSDTIAKLYWLGSVEDREHINQPLSRLVVDSSKLPSEWTAEVMAEWICALLSLALGRAIMWNHYFLSGHHKDYLSPKRLWLSRTLHEYTFVAFTEENNHLTTLYGLDDQSHAIKLTENALTFLLKNSPKTNENLLSTLEDYIFYSSSSTEDQQRCTLLCTTVEYLLGLWEASNTSAPPEIQKAKRRKVMQSVKSSVEGLLEDVFPKRDKELDEIYESRAKEFVDRIGQSVAYSLSDSFKNRLKWLLQSYGWYVEGSYWDTIGQRASNFVESRNKLFHDHRFRCDSEDGYPDLVQRAQAIRKEIDNIEAFVPLLFASLLHFEGRYWDKLTNKWEWMPDKEGA